MPEKNVMNELLLEIAKDLKEIKSQISKGFDQIDQRFNQLKNNSIKSKQEQLD
ncbi:hypothetical protein P4H42_17090 [Paenibacillus macerans]|uniref:hypothetical protein n=1 Tax=Paenibacillus macerans TaxID=44252 RepID=UPI002DBD8961|nr:hypothetical protein [Paenibacillus macerans]MEC0331329.1 hypothetical protein [Paenibacillus macerans]MED4954046.1 hypothetical protein [Paenibacillus macerans]